MPRLTRRALAALAVAAAVPSTANAAKITLGSSLAPAASITESHPRDWMAYPTAQADGGDFIAPAHGEVAWADVKGTIVEQYDGYPKPFVHMLVVVTRPVGGGDQLVVASEHLPFPYGGDPNRVTGYDLQALPARICVQRGDHIALSTSGGSAITSRSTAATPTTSTPTARRSGCSGACRGRRSRSSSSPSAPTPTRWATSSARWRSAASSC